MDKKKPIDSQLIQEYFYNTTKPILNDFKKEIAAHWINVPEPVNKSPEELILFPLACFIGLIVVIIIVLEYI